MEVYAYILNSTQLYVALDTVDEIIVNNDGSTSQVYELDVDSPSDVYIDNGTPDVLSTSEILYNQLQQAIQSQTKLIENQFNYTLQNYPTNWSGYAWSSSFDNITKLMGLVQLSQVSGVTSFIAYDFNNSPHNLDVSQIVQLGSYLGQTYQDNLYKKSNLISEIENSTSLIEVQSIEWE
jgi:hypothetical protein